MSTDIKLSKAHISKTTPSHGFDVMEELRMLDNLGKTTDKEIIKNLAIPLAKDVLPGLVSKIASIAALNEINKLERRINGKATARAGKGFTLFISNEDMDIIKIAEPFEKSGILLDGASKTVKHKIKKIRWKNKASTVVSLIAPMASSFIAPAASFLINAITGQGVKRAAK